MNNTEIIEYAIKNQFELMLHIRCTRYFVEPYVLGHRKPRTKRLRIGKLALLARDISSNGVFTLIDVDDFKKVVWREVSFKVHPNYYTDLYLLNQFNRICTAIPRAGIELYKDPIKAYNNAMSIIGD